MVITHMQVQLEDQAVVEVILAVDAQMQEELVQLVKAMREVAEFMLHQTTEQEVEEEPPSERSYGRFTTTCT